MGRKNPNFIKREPYDEIVKYVSEKSLLSNHRTRKILTKLGQVLKEEVRLGKDIEIYNILKIKYTSTKGYIISNETSVLDDQIAKVTSELGYPKEEVYKAVKFYYRRLKDLIELGYRVTIKSIASVIPKEDSEGVYFKVSISPVLLTCKVDNKGFEILTDDGKRGILEIEQDRLRYGVELHDKLKLPSRTIESKKLDIKVIEI